ncbi:MAG: DUF2089 domain-containing protein [bacterium]|nr:DUF2089 domain-containing protein [bacterium]
MEQLGEKKLPTQCPSCNQLLEVARLICPNCSTAVEGKFELSVLSKLGQKEQEFIIDLVKSSGSLKTMAQNYGISYPTVRNRLDAIIEQLKTLTEK